MDVLFCSDRRSHCRCSIKKLFLKISQYSQETTCVGVCFNKAAEKKETPTQVFHLWLLRNFQEHLFWKRSTDGCFSYLITQPWIKVIYYTDSQCYIIASHHMESTEFTSTTLSWRWHSKLLSYKDKLVPRATVKKWPWHRIISQEIFIWFVFSIVKQSKLI